MSHRFGLGETRQADRLPALQTTESWRERVRLVKIDTGHVEAADLEDQRFLDPQRVVAREGRRHQCDGFDRLGGAALLVHASTSFSALT